MEFASRGHEVKFLIEDTDAKRLGGIPHLTYTMLGREAGDPEPEVRIAAGVTAQQFLHGFVSIFGQACRGLMANQSALQAARDFKPDLLLSEMAFPCAPLIAFKLNVSWVSYIAISPLEPFFTSLWTQSHKRMFTPNPLAYMPQWGMRATSQHMTFLERLHNLLCFALRQFDDYMSLNRLVTTLHMDHGLDLNDPAERRRLVLSMAPVDMVVEWVRPMSPDLKMVGGILPEPGKPLPGELEAFMESAGEHGVLLASLGTIAELDLHSRVAMAAAFARLPCKVLWRLTPKEVPNAAAVAQLRLGNNTKVMTWVPQNDVLAHPRTRAFLSHMGVNSLYEAVYHGKPIIALPFFLDQDGNADKAVAKGYGVAVSPFQVATPAFQAALEEVLFNPRHAAAARAMSVKVRARKRTPAQEAADWLEHVIETGCEPYLHTPERYLPFIVRHNLDVYACLLSCIGLLTLAAWGLGRTALALAGRGLRAAKLKAS